MYVKVLKKTGAWNYGVEYFHAEVGAVFHVTTAVGMEMLATGIARRATEEEIPGAPECPLCNGVSRDLFKVRLHADSPVEGSL